VRYEPSFKHRVIFASHQWLGNDHPDPFGEQLTCLQHTLRRMMEGKIDSIQTNWVQQVAFKENPTLQKKDMVAALPHMFLWLGERAVCCLRAKNASPAYICSKTYVVRRPLT
jgi:hypothetical protein